MGDSVSYTLGEGLAKAAPAANVSFANRGVIGCGIATGGLLRDLGRVGKALDCSSIPQGWLAQTRLVKPDVVALMVGRWETYDRYYQGRWRAPGDPVYDAYLLGMLNKAVDELLARNVRVALLTPLCTTVHETASGAAAAEDDPARRLRFTQLLYETAQQHAAAGVEVIDVAASLCPHGAFSRTDAAGKIVRTNDGIHLTPVAGADLGPELFGELTALHRRELAPR
jgi:hypothetical protein